MVQPLVGGQERDDGRRDQEDQGGSPTHEHHGEAPRRTWGKAFQRDNVTRFFKINKKGASDIVQKEVYYLSVMISPIIIYCSYNRTFETKW